MEQGITIILISLGRSITGNKIVYFNRKYSFGIVYSDFYCVKFYVWRTNQNVDFLQSQMYLWFCYVRVEILVYLFKGHGGWEKEEPAHGCLVCFSKAALNCIS